MLSPYVPLLFMGEEYGETAPFLYFTSHGDPALIEAVRKGRREEFAAFRWQGETPDPQDESTFEQSKLHWESRGDKQQRTLWEFHAELLRLRKSLPALAQLTTHLLEVKDWEKEKVLMVRRWCKGHETIQVMNFSPCQVKMDLPIPEGRWRYELDSSDARWGGRATLPHCEIESPGITTCALPAHCMRVLSRPSGSGA